MVKRENNANILYLLNLCVQKIIQSSKDFWMLTVFFNSDCTFESLQIFFKKSWYLDPSQTNEIIITEACYPKNFFKKLSKKSNVKADLKSTVLNVPRNITPQYSYVVTLSYLNVACSWNLLVLSVYELIPMKEFLNYFMMQEKNSSG